MVRIHRPPRARFPALTFMAGRLGINLQVILIEQKRDFCYHNTGITHK